MSYFCLCLVSCVIGLTGMVICIHIGVFWLLVIASNITFVRCSWVVVNNLHINVTSYFMSHKLSVSDCFHLLTELHSVYRPIFPHVLSFVLCFTLYCFAQTEVRGILFLPFVFISYSHKANESMTRFCGIRSVYSDLFGLRVRWYGRGQGPGLAVVC